MEGNSITVSIKNMDDLNKILVSVQNKLDELQKAICKLNAFELEIEFKNKDALKETAFLKEQELPKIDLTIKGTTACRCT